MSDTSLPSQPSEFLSLQYRLEEHYLQGQPVELLCQIGHNPTGEEIIEMEDLLAGSGLHLLGPPEVRVKPWPLTLRLLFRRPGRQDLSRPLGEILGLVMEPLGWSMLSYRNG